MQSIISKDKTTTITTISPWLDTPAAADYIGCKAGTLKAWRSRGEGPRFRIINNKLVRYHRDDLDAYLSDEAQQINK